MKTKLCKDCKHFYVQSHWIFGKWVGCDYFKTVDPVNGQPRFKPCDEMRATGKCGPDGELWEPRKQEVEKTYNVIDPT